MKILYVNLNILNERCGGRDNTKSSVATFPLRSIQKRMVGSMKCKQLKDINL